MVFSDEQKNIIIENSEVFIKELDRLQKKIIVRNDEFIAQEGKKTSSMEADLTKLSNNELHTKIITLGKLLCEFVNIESQLRFQIKKINMEITRRQ